MNEYDRELMRTLQALAQPAEVQKALFPVFVVVADELVLDFDEALKVAKAHSGFRWSQEQLQTLQRLDMEIDLHSGPNFPEIWLDPDCLAHDTWGHFRALASAALRAFDWPADPPSPSGAIYVSCSGA